MNINLFKRIARLEAAIAELRMDNTTLRKELSENWSRMSKIERQAAAAISMTSTITDAMAKLPSLAVIEKAVALAKQFDERLDRVRDRIDKNLNDQWAVIKELDNEITKLPSRAVIEKAVASAKQFDKLLDQVRDRIDKNLNDQLAAIKGLDNEMASRKAVEVQLERDRAKRRGYTAAYRERQKAKAEAKAEAERRKANRLEYQRAYRARKKAEKAAQEASK
jgi:exonuclease VII small subunit